MFIDSGSSLVFVANGATYTIMQDHPSFSAIRDLLSKSYGDHDAMNKAIALMDPMALLKETWGSRIQIGMSSVFFLGILLSNEWFEKARKDPLALRPLTFTPGQKITVQGDDEAPDGIYEIADIDPNDHVRTVMVDNGEGFFGFISNESIKSVET